MWFFAKLFWISNNSWIDIKEEKVSFEKWEKSVILVKSWKSLINCIKLIREVNWYGLKDSKNLADNGWVIISEISLNDADIIKEKFENIWAIIEIN